MRAFRLIAFALASACVSSCAADDAERVTYDPGYNPAKCEPSSPLAILSLDEKLQCQAAKMRAEALAEMRAEKEIEACVDFAFATLKTFGFSEYVVELSEWDPAHPENYDGKREDWERATNALVNTMQRMNVPYKRMPGEAAFYGVSNTALKNAQDKGLKVKTIGSYGQPDTNYGYAVRKDDTEFLNKMSEGWKRLKASPKFQELVKKWELR